MLISPEWNFKGAGIADALRDSPIGSELSYLIMVGEQNSSALAAAKKLDKALAPSHQASGGDDDSQEQTLFFEKLETSVQGAKLLNEKTLKAQQKIGKFIEIRLVKQKIPWAERTNPFKAK